MAIAFLKTIPILRYSGVEEAKGFYVEYLGSSVDGEHHFGDDTPALPSEDFDEAVRIAQAEFDQYQPEFVVGPSRGGAVAMNIDTGGAKLVLLCPAWQKYGTARTVKVGVVILHSLGDDVVPFADREELVMNSSMPSSALVEVGMDHRLADSEPMRKRLEACEGAGIADLCNKLHE